MSKTNKSKSPSKRMVMDFLRATEVDDGEKAFFVFTIEGNLLTAENFIHRMRVDLSRMRTAVRELNRTPRHFKMVVREIDHDEFSNICTIKLHRTQSNKNVDNEVSELLDTLAVGTGGKVG